MATEICKKYAQNTTVKNATIDAHEPSFGSNIAQPLSINGNARQRPVKARIMIKKESIIAAIVVRDINNVLDYGDTARLVDHHKK